MHEEKRTRRSIGPIGQREEKETLRRGKGGEVRANGPCQKGKMEISAERREVLRERCRRYYEANKEKRQAKMKEYRITNRDALSAYKRCPHVSLRNAETHKLWRSSRLPLLAKRMREYRRKNPAAFKDYERSRVVTSERKRKRNECAKKWHERNPDNRAASYHKRRCRAKSGSDLTPSQLKSIRQRDKQCFYCHGPLDNKGRGHIEHRIPLSRGGFHTANNIAIACSSCNLRKGSKTEQEFQL